VAASPAGLFSKRLPVVSQIEVLLKRSGWIEETQTQLLGDEQTLKRDKRKADFSEVNKSSLGSAGLLGFAIVRSQLRAECDQICGRLLQDEAIHIRIFERCRDAQMTKLGNSLTGSTAA
jgi:hypothetical protein